MELRKEILKKAESYRPLISKFLRDIIALPSQSSNEGAVVNRIAQEMEKVGFDRIDIDPMGNILGYVGNGPRLIAMDGHIDTVDVGDPSLWTFDPYEGFEDEERIGGRGASDQKGGMASMVYGAKIMKELGLLGDCTVLITGTVQEEDCDGLCWQYIIEEDKIRPDFVLLTEPTACRVYRGQRGRMEIKVATKGVSCHGSAPERGDNAIYKMAPIILELRALHENLGYDEFLGRGSLTVSEIFFTSPSRCAVADSCAISIDRRLTIGETWEEALNQVGRLPGVKASSADVSLYSYARPSWKGLVYPTDCYFPAWVVEEDHIACRTLVEAHKKLFGEDPLVDKWTFSTNGVSIMGRYGIPCVGFGPGHEEQSHAPNEVTWKDELVKAAALYAAVPYVYSNMKS